MVVVQIQGAESFQFLYSSSGFIPGLDVTGYLIYPDRTKSTETMFIDLGDGIYSATFYYVRQTDDLFEKYGIIVKEGGVVKCFDLIQMIN